MAHKRQETAKHNCCFEKIAVSRVIIQPEQGNVDEMSIRLFVKGPLSSGATAELERDHSHYISNVMRKKAGDEVVLFNGRDGEWKATIVAVEKRSVRLEVGQQSRMQETEPDLWLAFAPIKKARLDFIAQKATELGVSNLTPVMTRRTIVDRVKTDRMLANAIEAAEQCERLTVPTINEATKLDAFLASLTPDRKLMFCDEDKTGQETHAALRATGDKAAPGPWAILIGPEGGFDDDEREKIRAHPTCVPVSLGPRVLRADTAAMAAISLWQSAIGDW